MYSYLEHHNLFYTSQYGFRTTLSTEKAIIELHNRILESFDSKHWTLGIFLDLSKAFDTLDHSILMSKLPYYGIRGIALQWFSNYLSDRKQCVSYKNTLSALKSISIGVPQGSILGPLLFLIYINDMHLSSTLSKTIHYADDTCLLYSSPDLATLFKIANSDLNNIANWLKANVLLLNISKSKYIVFHSHQKTSVLLESDFNIQINATKLIRSSEVVF